MMRFIPFIIVVSILLTCTGCSNEKPINKSDITNTVTETSKAVFDNEQKETEAEAEDTIPEDKDISSFIPSGWHILEKYDGMLAKAEGDLNKDGVMDIAFVIEEDSQPEQSETEMVLSPPRSLLIAFGNKDSTYSLSIKADNAIMLRDQGGVYGDPFEVDKGSILLKFYGGSNWRWYYNYRFRYQNEGWYLIGATYGSYFTGTTTMENADEEDYNLLTGDYIIKKADENGKMVTSKGNRGKRELLNLKDFVAGADVNSF
jgi:hypothetical protein